MKVAVGIHLNFLENPCEKLTALKSSMWGSIMPLGCTMAQIIS